MASVDFAKHTFTSGSAMVGHFTRHNGRENVEYRNKYINPELTPKNYCIGLDDGARVPTMSEIMDELRQRVAEIDELQPPKRRVKDRVTMMTYSISSPEGLTDEQQRAFFAVAYDEVAKMSGGRQNVSVGFVHVDEVHEYIDENGERKMSRPHLQLAGVPYTSEKGVNGKAFETRARMAAVNRAIDERCKRELGFAFLTGKKGLTGRTVEELQAASDTRAEEQVHAALNAQNAALERTVRENERAAAEAEKAAQSANERARAASEQADQLYALIESTSKIEPKVKKRIFSRREVVEVDPNEYRKLQAAASRVRKADKVLLQRDGILAKAKEQAAEMLREAKAKVSGIFGRSAEKQLEQIRRDRPELFNSSGVYVREQSEPKRKPTKTQEPKR